MSDVDMKKGALSNSILYGIGSVIKACASFFLLPLYTSILGASQYGQLTVLQTLSIIISTCMTLALERSLYRLYFDYKTEEAKVRFLSTVFISINAIGIVVLALFLLFGQSLTPYLGSVDYKSGLLPIVVYSYVNALIIFCQIVLQTKQEGVNYLIISLLFVIIYNLLCIIFLYRVSPTYNSMVGASLITAVLVFPIAFFMVKRQIRFYFNAIILKRVLVFSLPILGTVVFSWVLNFSDRLFLANLTDIEDVGLYSFAAKIVSVIPLLCGAIFQSYSPFFFETANTMSYEHARNKLKPINDTITFIICSACAFVAIVYNLLLHTIFSSEYLSSLNFFYFLLGGALIGQQNGIINGMLYQNKKTSKIAFVSIAGGVLSVCLNILLIRCIGSVGSAISNIIVSLVLVVATYMLAKKEYFIPFNFVLLVGGVGALMVMCICDYFIQGILVQLLVKVFIFVIYVFLIFRTRVLNPIVIRQIIDKTIPFLKTKSKV